MSESTDFSIGAVSRLTGISQHTLRIWERRYSAVQSHRTESGRRLYSSGDVERLTLLKALVDRGDRIGSIANDDIGTLRRRIEAFEGHSRDRSELTGNRIDVAVCGESVADSLKQCSLPGLNIVLSETDTARFRADLERVSADMLVLELPVIDSDTARELASLQRAARTDRALVLYGFGRDADVERLVSRGVKVMRAPADRHAVAEFFSVSGGPSAALHEGEARRPRLQPESPEQPPARRLTASMLQRLASATGTVECECPRHLVDIVRGLTAFEIYSEQCLNRNDDDAALHAYLHEVTAQARSMMEVALIRAAEADGIEI